MVVEMLSFIFSFVILEAFVIAMFIALDRIVSKKRSEGKPVFLVYAFGLEIIMWILITTEFWLVILYNVICDSLDLVLDLGDIYWTIESIFNAPATLAWWLYIIPCMFVLPAVPCIVGLVTFLRERKKPHLKDKLTKKSKCLLLVLASTAIRLALFSALDSIFLIHFNAQIPW